MKSKYLLSILAIIFCLNLTSFANSNDFGKKPHTEKNVQVETLQNEIDDTNVSPQADETVTMRDIALFLEKKKEHYPLSDEFIEKYQQSSGGYIDNARKAGLVVDKQLHEPNQKWHFFESWLYPSIEDGTLSWDESAKTRVYNKLLCPELLLWIYEAAEVDPVKVREAKEVAEQGKVAKTNSSTLAKNMRACVPWEDIERTILNQIDEDVETYSVFVDEGSGFTISGLQNQYEEGREVVFTVNVTDSTKEIDEVKVNDDILLAVSGTKYKFTMPSNDVTINVTLKDAEIIIPPSGGGDNDDTPPSTTGLTYNIKYDLGTRKTAKLIETTEELFNVFEFSGQGSPIITSISQMEYIYGGGYGGSGDSKWVTNDVLKFGTTSVNGSLTLALSAKVNRVIITGYVSDSACKIQVGDSESTDWTTEANDNKTTIFACSGMNETTKEVVEGKQTSTITIDFASTNSLKIAVTNKKPFYIASIEFVVSDN